MSKPKPQGSDPMPDPDDILRVMLNTPPQPHGGAVKGRKKPGGAKTKKQRAR